MRSPPAGPNSVRLGLRLSPGGARYLQPKHLPEGRCWFNAATTEAGRDALGYHERRDDQRNIGLGPEHDWSSHAADAFGLMAIACEEPARNTNFGRRIEYPKLGWM